MNQNNERERNDIRIDRDMKVDDDGRQITAYIETGLAVDKQFCIHTANEDTTWLNLYAQYNPFEDTLRLFGEISRKDGSESFEYTPTKAEV